jgi:MFS-type transporter involved in bile tolerance (Atg22 family)
LAAIFGLYVGISETVQRAVIPKYISSDLRGTAFGLYNVVVGTSFFISNITFGFLWDNYNLSTAISYSIIFTSTAIIGMFAFVKKISC